MEKFKKVKTNHSALDEDVIELLAEAQTEVLVPSEVANHIKTSIFNKIKLAKSCQEDGFSTQRFSDGEWVSAMPGAYYKILHNNNNDLSGVLSYLIKLDAGTVMDGHYHPFDEECLMIEGDLTLGSLTLNQGDFHFAAMGLNHASVSTENGCIAFIRGALPI